MIYHYVPKYYLKGFADSSNSSLIWVYEKGKNIPSQIPIKTTAGEKDPWPENIENYLTKEIENPANDVLDKIRKRLPITKEEKKLLSVYIIVMLKRVPRGLQRAKEDAPKIMEAVFNDTQLTIERFIKERPEKKELLQKHLAELPVIKSKWEKEFPRETWYKNFTPDTSPQVKGVLSSMTWIFLKSENKNAFITSDNPVFFFEGIGMGKPESQVIFPISRKIVLFASWQQNRKEGYFRIKESAIKEINKRIASAATRYVFYSKNDTGIVALVNKKGYEFKKLV
jgi:hypothetical protein